MRWIAHVPSARTVKSTDSQRPQQVKLVNVPTLRPQRRCQRFAVLWVTCLRPFVTFSSERVGSMWYRASLLVPLAVLTLAMGDSPAPLPMAEVITVSEKPLELFSLSDQRDSLVSREARKQSVPVWLALSIAHAENWSGDSVAVNPWSGCVGLMQVCPFDLSGDSLWVGTYREECGDMPLINRKRNVCVAMKVLRGCIDRFDRLATVLACYGGATRPTTRRKYVDDVARRTRMEWLK